MRHANDIWGSLAPEYDCTGHRGVFSLHMFYLRASYSWSRSVRAGPGLGFCLDQGSRPLKWGYSWDLDKTCGYVGGFGPFGPAGPGRFTILTSIYTYRTFPYAINIGKSLDQLDRALISAKFAWTRWWTTGGPRGVFPGPDQSVGFCPPKQRRIVVMFRVLAGVRASWVR